MQNTSVLRLPVSNRASLQPLQPSTPGNNLYESTGTSHLCAWPLPNGVAIQTRSASIAENLSRIDGAILTARNHGGQYLRVYQFPKSWSWARSYVARWNGLAPVKPVAVNSYAPVALAA
jgi:hypothetical protein